MKATIYPGKVCGSVKIPPSKSMAHRAIIMAALAQGTSHITNIDYSEDIKTTIDAMTKMGANIIEEKTSLTITGINKIKPIDDTIIQCNESGSSLRFLIPLFSLTNQEITFLGKNRLLKRPQGIYQEMFTSQGLSFTQSDSELTIKGALNAQEYTIDGSISSQFITGLLFTLPLLDKPSTIKIIPPFESKSYVDLTLDLIKKFGITIKQVDDLTFYIEGHQSYQAFDYQVEGDYSQFAFFAVLAAINNDLDLLNMNPNSLQGDKQILAIMQECGVSYQEVNGNYHVSKSVIKGANIDLSNAPDLGPILFTLGMYAKEHYHIYNAGRLRLKESDRIQAMVDALLPLNANITVNNDEITIIGQEQYHNDAMEVSGAKDHRIVMALSVMATTLANPLTITSAQAINKSYPSFFEHLQNVGIRVVLSDD